MTETSDGTQTSNWPKGNDSIGVRRLNDEGSILLFPGAASLNPYAMLFNHQGYVYDATTNLWEDYATADRANYAISMTEIGTASQLYSLTLPQSDGMMAAHGGDMISRNVRTIDIFAYDDSGSGTPTEGDTFLWQRNITVERPAINTIYIHRPRSVAKESVDSWPMDGTINDYSFPSFRRIGQLLRGLGRKA